ncbi:hypothetical protein M378DRAFT_26539 [Amanita muscaria Koide BX008]|uniref:Uncharacterized protein n=1 Tax=Amanita muscaria (strain Koide BX008) TaxID=946122 RepID=A0A0C2SC25_AMAMK|nr:hypothetical protein M378DRAFT_26539 [Amanita muscaria Koide BX008]
MPPRMNAIMRTLQNAETLNSRTVQLTESFASSHRVQLPQDNMGKVHGSLARAGKVKSQTPKVDKQEKKKTPKGRAKKRLLYNRRFVNVTTMQGGKRRM